jgi:hypothetical protein
MHADQGIYVLLACNSKIWVISLSFAIPYVAATAASVLPSAFSGSVWSGVKLMRGSTARNTKSTGREQQSQAGIHSRINLKARCAPSRCQDNSKLAIPPLPCPIHFRAFAEMGGIARTPPFRFAPLPLLATYARPRPPCPPRFAIVPCFCLFWIENLGSSLSR